MLKQHVDADYHLVYKNHIQNNTPLHIYYCVNSIQSIQFICVIVFCLHCLSSISLFRAGSNLLCKILQLYINNNLFTLYNKKNKNIFEI